MARDRPTTGEATGRVEDTLRGSSAVVRVVVWALVSVVAPSSSPPPDTQNKARL